MIQRLASCFASAVIKSRHVLCRCDGHWRGQCLDVQRHEPHLAHRDLHFCCCPGCRHRRHCCYCLGKSRRHILSRVLVYQAHNRLNTCSGLHNIYAAPAFLLTLYRKLSVVQSHSSKRWGPHFCLSACWGFRQADRWVDKVIIQGR